ncbi:hypothetical protein BS78_09G112200 [Paspalum vaginatum]|nr:hypothetical protein BS78_09G112200 [Paspalum vaginatum]
MGFGKLRRRPSSSRHDSRTRSRFARVLVPFYLLAGRLDPVLLHTREGTGALPPRCSTIPSRAPGCCPFGLEAAVFDSSSPSIAAVTRRFVLDGRLQGYGVKTNLSINAFWEFIHVIPVLIHPRAPTWLWLLMPLLTGKICNNCINHGCLKRGRMKNNCNNRSMDGFAAGRSHL